MPSPPYIYRPELSRDLSQQERAVVREPQDRTPGPSYYDISMLKPPVWKWEIAGYFFLGGVAAGSYALARLAERFGGEDFKEVTRLGTYAACAAIVPCPLLLIHDLGDPARFHHMLRVWKPSSAMNLGTWVLTAFSPICFAAGAREMLKSRGGRLNAVAGSIGILSDALGMPLALVLAAYTGVLISNSATPVWTRNKWLSPLFVIGALSTGASAIGLLMQAQKKTGEAETRARHALKKFSTVAHAAEAAAFTGYLASLPKEVRKPYTTGTMKHHTAMTYAGLAAAELLKHAPIPARWRKAARVAGHLLSLASAFSMRWAVVYAGHESGNDPEAARRSSRARDRSTYSNLGASSSNDFPPQVRRDPAPDPKAISTIEPALGYNPRHK